MASHPQRLLWVVTLLSGLVILGFSLIDRQSLPAEPPRAPASEPHPHATYRLLPRVVDPALAHPNATSEPANASLPPTVPPADLASAELAPISAPAEARIRTLLRRDFEGLVETRRPDGGYSLSLQGRFRHLSAIVSGPQTTPVARCFSCADELFRAMETTAQTHSK